MKPSLAAWVLLTVTTPMCAASFDLLVTVSPPGPSNQNPATWGGVLQYHLDAPGAEPAAEPGIVRDLVADPAGLAFRDKTHEVFVANRHGNNQPSSISRFHYDFVTRELTPNGSVTGNGLYGVHQVTFHPISGELFAANVNNGVSRFTFDEQDQPVPNGSIANGSTRGVAVSLDGLRLYVTTGTGAIIRQFDLTTGAELPSVSVPSGVGGLHYLRIHRGLLYVAALYDDRVYRYTIDSNNDLSLRDSLAMNDPVAVSFSPDGGEMFVTGHRTSDLIYRYRWDSGPGGWVEGESLDTGTSLGDVLPIADSPIVKLDRPANPGNPLTLSWPIGAEEWIVESVSVLGGPEEWSSLSLVKQTNATRVWVILPMTGESGFFRIKPPPGP